MVLAMYHKTFKYLSWLESIEVARPVNWYISLYVQKWGKFELLYLGNESTFWKMKKKVFTLWSYKCIKKKSNICHD